MMLYVTLCTVKVFTTERFRIQFCPDSDQNGNGDKSKDDSSENGDVAAKESLAELNQSWLWFGKTCKLTLMQFDIYTIQRNHFKEWPRRYKGSSEDRCAKRRSGEEKMGCLRWMISKVAVCTCTKLRAKFYSWVLEAAMTVVDAESWLSMCDSVIARFGTSSIWRRFCNFSLSASLSVVFQNAASYEETRRLRLHGWCFASRKHTLLWIAHTQTKRVLQALHLQCVVNTS